MKFFRYGELGCERPAIFDDSINCMRDISEIVDDINGKSIPHLLSFFSNCFDISTFPIVEGNPRIGAPISSVSKFIAIGLNYKDHAQEANLPIPDEPVVFFKAPSSISGPFDDIHIPPNSKKLDWEAELTIVIGQEAKRVSKDDALNYVAGYCITNDISDRGFQFQTSQWDKAKSCDTFGPIGPFILTKDEVDNPHNLAISLEVNGEIRQLSNTSEMIFSIADIVSHVSHYMTLKPGDLIATGTPAGVGLGMKPKPVWLKNNDIVKTKIEGLGSQEQRVVSD